MGIDSGFRNIALTTRTPVVEIRPEVAASSGYPSYEVFVPKPYRDLHRYLDLKRPSLRNALDLHTDMIDES